MKLSTDCFKIHQFIFIYFNHRLYIIILYQTSTYLSNISEYKKRSSHIIGSHVFFNDYEYFLLFTPSRSINKGSSP